MKIKITFLAVLVLLLASCFTTTQFTPVSTGHSLPQPLDTELLAKSIRLSLVQYGWVIEEDRTGLIEARYSKSEGAIVADIRIEYDKTGYVISYVDSSNLDADLEEGVIHKNYVRWIANLNKSIYTNYIQISP